MCLGLFFNMPPKPTKAFPLCALQETVGLDMTRTAEAAGTTGVLAYDLNIKDIEQEFFEKNGYR
jgi:hypothetical protein